MDVVVRTGETKADSAALAALSFSSPTGEQAVLLLHAETSGAEGKSLEAECGNVVRHALLEGDGEPWTRLDGTLKELNGLFKGFLAAGSLRGIHAIVAILDTDGALHVSTAGRGEVYLIRGGAASQITEYTKGKPVPAFIHISSGSLESGDTVVFSTQRLLRALTPAQLAQLSHRQDRLLKDAISSLEAEKEIAALASLHMPAASDVSDAVETPPPRAVSLPSRRGGQRAASTASFLQGLGRKLMPAVQSAGKAGAALGKKGAAKIMQGSSGVKAAQGLFSSTFADLKDPRRKRRAHFLLLAGALATFLVVWFSVSMMTSSQRSKTRAELSDLVTQINDEIRTADNRRLAGDMDGANSILQRAEERAKQVMDNESGLFRVEALDLLDRIRSKREEINNITRVPARVLVNMSAKSADVAAQGLIGLGEGEFLVYDRQNTYRVLLNRLDDPKRIADDDLILRGADFPRYKSQVFETSGNSVMELSGNEVTSMKTEDPNGWITGKDIETYLRYLYVLAPDRKQIYKYERLSNRYSAPVEYNVNGDLTGAIDMTIDANLYVLKEGGSIVKLLRGETRPFVIRHAPDDALKNATKMFKVPDSNFYFLDPVRNRVIVATDGGATGESSYLKQYVLEGEQLGTLQDLYIDVEESHAYVLDEKRVYVVDLTTK